MSSHQEDLDLLLSLQDRVLETPPDSPSSLHSQSPRYLSDDEFPKRMGKTDMSAFKSTVQDFLDYEPQNNKEAPKSKRSKNSNDVDVEKFSGLRIRDQLVPSAELKNRFSDIRFVRLPAIKNLLMGDMLSGSWATVGVLTEKGNPKTSSTGKNYCIWKVGCLDEKTTSVFLFGDAYQTSWKEPAGTVFALFNCGVRKDAVGAGYSLSVFSAGQMLKIGTSIDYGVCKGKRKDGMTCTLAINKRHGMYCKYHKTKASEKYSVTRTELKGGNLRTAFRVPLKSEGIYLVDPLADKTNLRKPMQPVKLLSVEGLKRALSNAGKVTTNTHSQGIRFLNEMAGKMGPKITAKGSAIPKKQMPKSEQSQSSTMKVDASTVRRNQPPDAKKMKTEQGQSPSVKTKQATEKMVELEYISSDEEI